MYKFWLDKSDGFEDRLAREIWRVAYRAELRGNLGLYGVIGMDKTPKEYTEGILLYVPGHGWRAAHGWRQAFAERFPAVYAEMVEAE